MEKLEEIKGEINSLHTGPDATIVGKRIMGSFLNNKNKSWENVLLRARGLTVFLRS